MTKTEHRGYSISYSENEDVWRCYDVGASHEKLSRVKAKIDEMHRKMRKANAFHCLTVSSHQGVSCMDATVVEYIGPVRKRKSFERVGTGEVIDHEVAFMSARGGLSDKKTRQKGHLGDLVLDTPENIKLIAEADRLDQEARKLNDQAREILKKLSSPTISDIAPLVEASEHRFEEQNEAKT